MHYFSKTHCIGSHSTAVQCDPVQANTLHLQSAFGVCLVLNNECRISWRSQSPAVTSEKGAGYQKCSSEAIHIENQRSATLLSSQPSVDLKTASAYEYPPKPCPLELNDKVGYPIIKLQWMEQNISGVMSLEKTHGLKQF